MKLSAMMKYEGTTLLKACSIFYAVCLMIIFAIVCLNWMLSGIEVIGSFSGLEAASIIFIGISNSALVSDDFKLFIQNGFTRKQIYILIVLTAFILAVFMAFVDSLFGGLFSASYFRGIFTQLYGSEINLLMQWMWMITLYFSCGMVVMNICLLYHRVGKKMFAMIVYPSAMLCFMIIPLITPTRLMKQVINAFTVMMGYLANGTIQLINPILSFSTLALVGCLIAYLLMKRLELK